MFLDPGLGTGGSENLRSRGGTLALLDL
eukprot:SAG31_NODE_20729_length_566_cov_1.790150_1_plen_27_part_10